MHFADDYQQARQVFLKAAEGCGARLEHHELPGHRGPDGRPLFIDIAMIGLADPDVVVLSLSGTHGVEGFCGSAAQACWLSEKPALPPGVAMLFVHAVNPFGFAHMVRYNENNVDLNRNFVDFGAPLPENPLFETLEGTIPKRVGFDEDLVEEWAAAYDAFWKTHGDWAASDAASRGQYTLPHASQYGGDRPQWSSEILLSRVKTLCGSARHITYLDWHSLVRLGDGELLHLCFNQTGDPLFRRAATWWGETTIDRDAVNRKWGKGWSRSERRPSRHGLMMWGLQHMLAPTADVAGAVIEFCADADRLHSGLRAGVRLRIFEQWLLTTRGYDTPDGRAIVERLREATSPTRRSFMEKGLDAAMDAYSKAVAGAGDWARENIPATPGLLQRSSSFQ